MLDTIFKRRSIRKYTDEPVKKEDLNLILKAGMYAPSASNTQPWHFVVVESDVLQRVKEFHPVSAFAENAKAGIFVCGIPHEGRFKDYWMIDCSSATQNMLLAVEKLGLGACWIGIYPREERAEKVKDILALPKGVHPFSLIAIGHPAEEKPVPERFDSNRIHYGKW